jgi:hypothetical protein
MTVDRKMKHSQFLWPLFFFIVGVFVLLYLGKLDIHLEAFNTVIDLNSK